MLFEDKMNEIFKNEGFIFITFLIFVLSISTAIIFFILDEYNPTKYFNLIMVAFIYILLFRITVQKGMIVKKIMWIKENYTNNPYFVYEFLRSRKSRLYKCRQDKLHNLYEEALQLFTIRNKKVT